MHSLNASSNQPVNNAIARKKTVLFTCLTFLNYTGSEINTLRQAAYLRDQGYHVDVFALEIGDPLKIECPDDIGLIDHSSEDELLQEYDLIISRQWPLLEYILFAKGIHGQRVYFEAVSWRLPVDFFPYFYKDLTMVGYVSERVKTVMEDLGYDTQDAYYFPNYADASFFQAGERKQNTLRKKQSPEKIVVVTNHPPHELVQFVELARTEQGLEVDIFGMGNEQKLVDANLLMGYDVVVSIGKTLFYSLAMGMPSYSYDETSSVGYITKENYSANLLDNMASSKGYARKTPSELIQDILRGYEKAISDGPVLREMARNDFYFDELMEDFLNEICARDPMEKGSIQKKYPFAQQLSRVYVDDVAFFRKDIQRWYEKSMELGQLLDKAKRDWLEDVEELSGKLSAIENSTTWKIANKLKAPLYSLRRRLGKKDR